MYKIASVCKKTRGVTTFTNVHFVTPLQLRANVEPFGRYVGSPFGSDNVGARVVAQNKTRSSALAEARGNAAASN